MSLYCTSNIKVSELRGTVGVMWTIITVILSVLFIGGDIDVAECSPDAERLYTYLMRDYSKLIRPVPTNEEVLSVLLSLKFLQLIAVVS